LGNPAWSGRAVRAKLTLSLASSRATSPLKVLMSMPFTIRRLTAADAQAYRDIRLEGLARHPDGFGSAWEDEAGQPLGWFEQRIVNSAVFGGFLNNESELAGVTGLVVQQGAKQRHKGALVGMYVRPAARRTGLALALVQAVLIHARTVVEEVQLTVAPHNEAAQRLYRSVGFVEYAREPRSLKIDGKYHESVLMTLPFDPMV
jgi:ribosomal protein S18 acetylase RimI-like enzyme